MTCAGLLGLAIAFASKSNRPIETEKPKDPKKDEDDDPFSRPPAPGADPSKPPEKVKSPEDVFSAVAKGAVDRGLAALGRILAQNQNRAGNGISPVTSHAA